MSQSVQSLSSVQLFVTPWTTAHQASLSITNSQRLPKPMSIESVMPCNHLILCHPLLLPSMLPSIRVFSSESALRIRWPKYWSFSFNISPSNEMLNESKRLLNRVPLSLAFQRMCLIFRFMLGQGRGRKLRSTVWLKARSRVLAWANLSYNPADLGQPKWITSLAPKEMWWVRKGLRELPWWSSG